MTRKISDLLRRKNFAAALRIAEKEIYLAAYKHANYNQVKAAKLLGVNRGTFINRLTKWGIFKVINNHGQILGLEEIPDANL